MSNEVFVKGVEARFGGEATELQLTAVALSLRNGDLVCEEGSFDHCEAARRIRASDGAFVCQEHAK